MRQSTPPIHTIGTTEHASFPVLDLVNVPAKIDTGADSSAIWASEIILSPDRVLSFVLFGKGSKFYSGKRIEAKHFRSSMVKNTSGVAEERYKVSLTVQIGERKIRAWFNLSDRASMRYPVLIGRRLLHNKFIVDVSKRQVHSRRSPVKRILVLGAPQKQVGDFFHEIAKLSKEKVTFDARSFNELLFKIDGTQTQVRELVGGRDISTYDLVHFKTHRKHYELAISAAEYLDFHHINFFDRELAEHVAYDKLTEMMRLALAGLPVPLTYCGSPQALIAQVDEILAAVGGPFICKEINSDRGRGNYMLHAKEELLEVLGSAGATEFYMVQEYLENDGYVRALVFSPDVAIMIGKRSVPSDNPRKRHLNNPAGATNVYLINPDDEPDGVRELAVTAARLMRRQVAGVDLIYSKQHKMWYILEANTAPQIRTGAYPQQKAEAFAKFIDLQLNK